MTPSWLAFVGIASFVVVAFVLALIDVAFDYVSKISIRTYREESWKTEYLTNALEDPMSFLLPLRFGLQGAFIATTVLVTMLFIAAPQARAQSQDDLALMQTFLAIMTDYFEIIESTHDVASNPEKAAILQMMKIQEVYEARGEKARSTEILKQTLEDTNNTTIRNAAYMLLGDTLKETGRVDEALEYLRRGLDENIKAAQ